MRVADANIDRTRGRGGQPNHTPGGITRNSLLEVTDGGSLIQASAVSNVVNPAVYPQPDTELTHSHPGIPYEAELHRSWSNHTIISHDPLLNKDGLLYSTDTKFELILCVKGMLYTAFCCLNLQLRLNYVSTSTERIPSMLSVKRRGTDLPTERKENRRESEVNRPQDTSHKTKKSQCMTLTSLSI